MILNVKIDVAPALQHMTDLVRQLPYITSVAIDRTIKDVQKAEQDHVALAFILRRPDFIKGTIKITQFSKRNAPTSTLAIDPKRDFLAKFEAGGSKVAQSGRLAVPLEARPGKGGIVPKGSRPSALTNAFTITTKKGHTLLVTRVSKSTGTKRRKKGLVTGKDKGLKIWYVLKPSVPIRPTLTFLDIANRVAMQRWPVNAKGALDYAINTPKKGAR